MIKIEVDPQTMQELLDQPGVVEHVAQMTPETLEWFKDYLVNEDIYAKYVAERQSVQIKAALKRKRH